MILTEHEMQMARELARAITKNYNFNDEEVLEVVGEFVNNLKSVVIDTWNHIKEVVNNIIKIIHEKEEEKKYTYNWRMLLEIKAPPMPDMKIPRLANARSNI